MGSKDEEQPPREDDSQVKLIARIIADVVQRRSEGEIVLNDEIIAAHPELMPALREELRGLDSVHQLIVDERRRNPNLQSDDPSRDISAPESPLASKATRTAQENFG
jgi:hypothetical protein